MIFIYIDNNEVTNTFNVNQSLLSCKFKLHISTFFIFVNSKRHLRYTRKSKCKFQVLNFTVNCKLSFVRIAQLHNRLFVKIIYIKILFNTNHLQVS